MASIVHIASTTQFSNLLSSSAVVVADFYADWCGPCRAIAPVYEQLSDQLSRKGLITFAKINTEEQKELSAAYSIRSLPTFLIFKNARQIEEIQGADQRRLSSAIQKIAQEASKIDSGASDAAGSSSGWQAVPLPKGYIDVTTEVDVKGLDMLNWDSSKGNARKLFGQKPNPNDETDHVESDADEQLMVYIPFQSTLKIHSLQITSAPTDTDDDERPSRPKRLKLFINKPQALGFDDAESSQATQEFELDDRSWDPVSNTASLELRFVKFQRVYSLVLFIAESEGDNEKVRLDRVKIVGETGEKRDGKIEKISHDD